MTLNANTSTQLAPANPNRIELGIQCGTGGVFISETGQTLAIGASYSIPVAVYSVNR